MTNTVTRVTSEIPESELAKHFKVDDAGNLTISSKELADAIKNKMNTVGGGPVNQTAHVRVAVDVG